MSLILKKLTGLCHLPEQNDHGPQDKCGEGVSEAICVGPFSLWALGKSSLLHPMSAKAECS